MIALLTAGLLGAGTLSGCASVDEKMDKLILLEEKNPGYTELLLPSLSQTGEVISATADIQDRRNYYVNSLTDRNGEDGYILKVNADGSIYFSGANSTGGNLYFSMDASYLPDADYVLSDGDEHTENAFMYFEGVTMLPGGKTEYHTLARTIDNTHFTKDSTEYQRFNTVLVIKDGFSSDGITFYPMIQREDHASDEYEPAITTRYQPHGERTSLYNLYQFPKTQLEKITSADWKLLCTNLESGVLMNDWTSISFGDGTGVEFRGNSADDAVYGMMNSIGQVEEGAVKVAFHDDYATLVRDDGSELGSAGTGINGIEVPDFSNAPLDEVTEFDAYLKRISDPKYTVFLAIHDDGTRALTDGQKEQLSLMGLTADFADMTRYSYLAVIDQGILTAEDSSETKAVETNGVTNKGVAYTVKSAGYSAIQEKEMTSILLDGLEYGMDRRGMNFVIYDNDVDRIVDSVVFDTNYGLKCYRPLDGVVGVDPNAE